MKAKRFRYRVMKYPPFLRTLEHRTLLLYGERHGVGNSPGGCDYYRNGAAGDASRNLAVHLIETGHAGNAAGISDRTVLAADGDAHRGLRVIQSILRGRGAETGEEERNDISPCFQWSSRSDDGSAVRVDGRGGSRAGAIQRENTGH